MHAAFRLSLWRMLARRHPSAFLLAAQLLSLLLYPLMDQTSEGRMLFGGVAVVVVPLAVWTVSRSPFFNITAWLLAVPSLLLTIWVCWVDDTRLLPVAAGLEALLYFYAAAGLIAYMMRDVRVTADELFAAGATFTLIAWGFAYAYFVCQSWYPDSFTGFEPERERTWLELLFFSVSNLSATGLGDVLPVNAPARVLTMLEQIAGVGYIATVVSRLIGLTIIQQKK
ncbi:putative transmembrane ion channel [Lysobacter dokdonensis DS-58]|uniref:Putative transmembrane ion channel n=1 Tax=Lysobacter dokdonensis DS-58 TaxID=1300345 RepID=A0A0A2WJ35_9GAMM|nr:potassium channel family protein [Lysobacter dokdonensis]KGQ18275.1 putative transmembrane ion channel [Lysobacter dokdonensis DS-58]